MRTGTANLPLHGGQAPGWLFQRMKRLARAIAELIVEENGPRELLARLSDPFWFQAFGCVLGFDWHSSGVTTTAMGALKEGLKGAERDLGVFVAGGKGAVSRRTPDEIIAYAERGAPVDPEPLVYASRMSAKVDNTAVQDGFQLYHHAFIFTKDGAWAVVQQGMNEQTARARRYHWLSDSLTSFVREPHAAVVSEANPASILNMVADEAEANREITAQLSHEKPEKLAKEVARMRELVLPAHHQLLVSDLRPESLPRILEKAYDRQPESFQELLEVRGVGPKGIRALALIADLVYGAPASVRDPARYAFAHGGKDGTPFPVDRQTYDRSIEILRKAISKARLGRSEQVEALRRLQRFYRE